MAEKLSFSKIYSIIKSNLHCSDGDIPLDFTVRPVKSANEILSLQVIFTNYSYGKLLLNTCTVPINNSNTDCTNFSKNWKLLISDQQLMSAPSTLAETLLAERMRTLKLGISYYDIHFESNNLIFINDGLMYSSYFDKNDEVTSLHMLNMNNAINVKRNPINCQLLSYVKDRDVFIIDILINSPFQITFSGPNIGSGSTHYIIQEEFDRIDGMWWRPFEENKNEYHLLIEEYDEGDVKKLTIPCYTFGFENEEYRYPHAGQNNAKSNLKILKIKADSENDSFNFEVLELSKELFQLFPEYEYLTNAGWTPDGKFVWIQLADRLQNCISTFLLSFDNFSSKSTNDDKIPNGYAVHFHKVVDQKFWVPVNMNTSFLKPCKIENPIKNACKYSSIIGQSNNGFNHLCFVEKYWDIPSKTESFSIINPEISTHIFLTSGEWEVDIHKIWVNEKDTIVYFLANRDDILANHLYSLNYGNKKNSDTNSFSVVEITNGDSIVYLNPDDDWGVVTTSSLESPVKVKLLNFKNPNISEFTIFELVNPFNMVYNGLVTINQPKLLSYNIFDDLDNEIKLYGLLFLPNSTEVKKWPTLHYVYGGPSVRLVENNFNKNFVLFAQKINYFGFALLVCDGRGSSRRGRNFEGHIKHKLGTVELNDQIFFLRKAAEETGLIDLDRVGIYGSSYGGYLTLMAMFKHFDTYKCGFSSSPVVDFRYYDTAYTERYLGIPDANCQQYTNASVLTYLSNLPKDHCRLIVAHGGKDENVHFLHTANLLRFSNLLGFDIKFLFYPNSRHGIKDRAHLDSHLIKFLYKHL